MEEVQVISIRAERAEDHDAVRAINRVAFDGGPESALVDALRVSCPGHVSLVAEDEGRVVGHILFTPVIVGSVEGGIEGMGLGPMAVLSECRRIGVGSALVRRGLGLLRDRSCPFVVVVGHPDYYPRFGFEVASLHGLESQWEGVPDEAFMVRVFDRDALPANGGVARYQDEFDAAM